MIEIAFQTINWANIETEEFAGETGVAFWQTILAGGLRLRTVEFSSGYIADHWCQKGHIVHCLEGMFLVELSDGNLFPLNAGESFLVSDGLSSHRLSSVSGAKILIIDGDFLKFSKDQ